MKRRIDGWVVVKLETGREQALKQAVFHFGGRGREERGRDRKRRRRGERSEREGRRKEGGNHKWQRQGGLT